MNLFSTAIESPQVGSIPNETQAPHAALAKLAVLETAPTQYEHLGPYLLIETDELQQSCLIEALNC